MKAAENPYSGEFGPMPLTAGFYRQCRLAPDNTAFIEGERALSYRQVQQQVERLSIRLSEQKKRPQRVAIAVDRGIDAAIAILAVLGAGACYIPLDLGNPAERLNFIIRDAAPHCILGIGPCPVWLDESALWLAIDEDPAPSPVMTRPSPIDSEALAAILYTSGSTGLPKGVALSHRALSNFVDWASDAFGIGADDRIASLAPFHFDLSVFDLFASLSRGAAVHFMPLNLTLSPSRLTAWLKDHRISIFYTVPSLLGFIALKGSLNTTGLPDLKTVLFAGEVFPTAVLKKLCALLPQVDFYNLYGPTETNVCCYWKVERKRLDNDRPIPIGHPACGAVLKIDGDTGELLVKCANNLSGYWQNGRLAVPHTTGQYYPTGDKVSLNETGEYCYHGRLDRMLKCSGYRIEPAEIETAILKCPEVSHCAVVGVGDGAGGRRPAAAVVLKDGAEMEAIVRSVKQRLPAYMHPCRFIVLDSLPYLSNGKTDYQGLLQLLEKN
jgi:amino acid adenylation domain-containing protein